MTMTANRALHALSEECRRFARYLLDAEPDSAEVERYARAVQTLPAVQCGPNERLLSAARSPLLLPFLDAGTSYLRLDCPFRRRLMLAAAIFEASPRHADRFLPCETSIARMAVMGLWTGLRMAVLVPLGVLLVKALHRP
ncbi:hypothetical protein GC173_18125 [bacterium]|nr:hypothetical protein [bacterium]